MKYFHRISLSLVVLSFVAFGCQEAGSPESSYSSSNGSRKTQITSSDYTSIQNPNNYRNFCGVLHNAGVDYLYQSAKSGNSTRELTSLESAQLTVDFLNSVSNPLATEDLDKLKGIAQSTLNSIDNNTNVSTAFASLNLNTEQIFYCQEVLTTIQSPATNDLNSMLSALSVVETNILNSASLSYDDKDFPLTLVAIAKHSAFYHAQIFSVGGTPLVVGSGKNLTIQKTQTARWKDVVESDALGAAWGAAIGFVGGAIRGGIGALLVGGAPGGIAGAAGGAIVGSVVGAVTGGIAASGHSLTKEVHAAEEPH